MLSKPVAGLMGYLRALRLNHQSDQPHLYTYQFPFTSPGFALQTHNEPAPICKHDMGSDKPVHPESVRLFELMCLSTLCSHVVTFYELNQCLA